MNIKRPIITEKSLGLAGHGWYTFAVDKHVRKQQAAREIEKIYHVNVVTARMIAMHGKVRRTGKKMVSTHRPDWKKVIVQLNAGQKIDAFEVTKQEQAPAEEPKKIDEKKVEKKKGVKSKK